MVKNFKQNMEDVDISYKALRLEYNLGLMFCFIESLSLV